MWPDSVSAGEKWKDSILNQGWPQDAEQSWPLGSGRRVKGALKRIIKHIVVTLQRMLLLTLFRTRVQYCTHPVISGQWTYSDYDLDCRCSASGDPEGSTVIADCNHILLLLICATLLLTIGAIMIDGFNCIIPTLLLRTVRAHIELIVTCPLLFLLLVHVRL